MVRSLISKRVRELEKELEDSENKRTILAEVLQERDKYIKELERLSDTGVDLAKSVVKGAEQSNGGV